MHQVPVDVTVALLKSAMQAHAAGGREDFLIDGFPRNQDNVEGWDRVMCGSGAELCFALHFECGQDLMVQRLLLRAQVPHPQPCRTLFCVVNDAAAAHPLHRHRFSV